MLDALSPTESNALMAEAWANVQAKHQQAERQKRDRLYVSVREQRGATLYEVANPHVYLNLHSGQMRAWQSEKRVVAMIAGSQGGKTSFGPWWLAREIEQRGAGDYLAVTATYDLFELKMLPEMRTVFEEILHRGRWWAANKVIELSDPKTGQFKASKADDPMWGRIILRSANAAGGLESATAKGAWLDEAGQDAFTFAAYEAIRRRLALNKGRQLLTTTLYNLGWLVQNVVNKAGVETAIDLIQFESILNPIYPVDEFEQMRIDMPDWKFNMFMRGLVHRPPGMIYKDFIDKYREDGGHKVKPFELPTAWPRYVGVDPGAVHQAIVWFAKDPDHDVFYLYREGLEGDKSTPEYVRDAKALAEQNHERVIMWFIGQKAEVQQRLDWRAAGVPNVAPPVIHDVEGGIDRVIRLLRQHRLYIFDTCKGTLDQFARYSRKLDANSNPTEDIKDKDTFHYLDAVRYATVGVSSNNGLKVINL